MNQEMKWCGVVVALSVVLAACAPLPNVVDEKQERTLDGVKLIAAGIDDREDPSTFNQAQYGISSDHRLLMRYEGLSDVAKDVRTEGDHKVSVLVASPSADDLKEAQKSLKICPLKRNWMMAATWKRAHPFNKEGHWSVGGGDFDSSECVTSSVAENSFAVFDVTPWFTNYVRGRNQNFGLILVSDVSLHIAGDADGQNSPRIRWTTTSQVYPVPQATWTPTPSHAN